MTKQIERGTIERGTIEQLTATYDATLIEYNKAIADAAEYNIVKGQTYMNKSLDEGAATNVEECEAMCSANKLCTGATFNEQEQYCRTSSGQGNPTVSNDGDYAIISNKHKIKSLEKRLETLNGQIADLMETVDEAELDANDEELKELLEETPQEEDFGGSLVENSIIVLRHNKYVYIGLAIGALLLAIITFKLSAAAIVTAVTAATSSVTSLVTSSPITSSINSSPISLETPIDSPTTDISMPEMLDLTGGGKMFSLRKVKFPSFKKLTSIPMVIMFLASAVAYLLTKQ
jgi:hypothetical protein